VGFTRLGPYQFAYINSATTTQVQTGQGVLHAIQVNGGTLGAITVIDGTSGSTGNIAVITPPASSTDTYLYDLRYINGLRIVTAAATDITVTWA